MWDVGDAQDPTPSLAYTEELGAACMASGKGADRVPVGTAADGEVAASVVLVWACNARAF